MLKQPPLKYSGLYILVFQGRPDRCALNIKICRPENLRGVLLASAILQTFFILYYIHWPYVTIEDIFNFITFLGPISFLAFFVGTFFEHISHPSFGPILLD